MSEKTPNIELSAFSKTQHEFEDPIMEYFEYRHLPSHLQLISEPFCSLAEWIVKNVPRNAERTVALRKLLEGKDAAVRAALPRREKS